MAIKKTEIFFLRAAVTDPAALTVSVPVVFFLYGQILTGGE
jgi:hypothetical protein